MAPQNPSSPTGLGPCGYPPRPAPAIVACAPGGGLVLTLGHLLDARLASCRHCPHCGNARSSRWGRFSGRQRFRCSACRRTWSAFTGTAMAYTKRPELWGTFARCMLASLSVRETAARVGIDKDTAWRWRHRALAALVRAAPTALRGVVEVHDTNLPLVTQGELRGLYRYRRRDPPGEWVLIARDAHAVTLVLPTGDRPPSANAYNVLLAGACSEIRELWGAHGLYSAACRFAAQHGLPYARHRGLGGPGAEWEAGRPQVRLYALRLRTWLRRFRGIGTRYVWRYLHWNLVLERADEPARRLLEEVQRAPPSRVSRHQQFLGTDASGARGETAGRPATAARQAHPCGGQSFGGDIPGGSCSRCRPFRRGSPPVRG